MNENPKTRYDGLQCLRAIAAFLVLWAHIKFIGNFSGYPILKTAAGAVGVDIFFVLSGFVISLTSSKPNRTWKSFLVNRISRVVPFYYLMSLPFAALEIRKVINYKQLWDTFLFFPISGNMITTYHRFGWTLSFELWFYTIFTIMLFFFNKRAKYILAFFLITGTIFITCLYNGDWFFLKFIFNPFVLEFCFGILLFELKDKIKNKFTFILFGAAVLVLGYFVLVTQHLGYHRHVLEKLPLSLQRVAIWGTFSLCVVGLALSFDQFNFNIWPRWLVRLGDASYSLYLIQPFTLDAINYLKRYVYLSGLVSGLLFLSSSIILSLILFRYVEVPLTNYFRRRLNHRMNC